MKNILFSGLAALVICACVTVWLILASPKLAVSGKVSAVTDEVLAQPELSRDEQRAESLIQLRMENNGDLKVRDFYTQNYPAAVHVQVHFEVLEWGGQTSQHSWTIVFSKDGKELKTTKSGELSKTPTKEDRKESILRKVQREQGDQRQVEVLSVNEIENGNQVHVEAECEVKKPNGTSVKKTWKFTFEKGTNALMGYTSPY